MTITYVYGKNLYVNLTNRCPNACDFCLRTTGDHVGDSGSLWLEREPTKEEILTDEIMYYYLGLLNSKLINYVFISKSGNTQVSANELNLLPFSKNNVKDISAFVSKYLSELREHQEELDRLVCEAYDLSVNEINMILDY